MSRYPPHELHFSDLKRIARSPMHFRAGVLDPQPATPAMLFGTLVHAIVLGGRFRVYPGDRRGNAWKDFVAKHAGERIVTEKEHERALPCAQAVLDDPVAAPYIDGQMEAFLRWEWMSTKVAGTLDILDPAHGRIVDVKTSTCSEPSWFTRQAERMGYHAQLAWYREGARQNGHEIDECYAIVVETKAPYPVTVMRMTEDALELGLRQCVLWTGRYRGCLAADEWPGYVQHVVDLDIQPWEGLTGFDDEDAT